VWKGRFWRKNSEYLKYTLDIQLGHCLMNLFHLSPIQSL